MKPCKKIVDERQQLELMRIERIGFWVIFFGLVVSSWVQQFFEGFDSRWIMNEVLWVAVGGTIVIAGCLRKGLWSYTSSKPSLKANLLASLVAGLLTGGFTAGKQYIGLPQFENRGSTIILNSSIVAGSTFLLCILALTAAATLVNRRRAKLEAALEVDEEDE